MGTRADFYIGTGKDAEWLGSLGWDGYRIEEMTEQASTKSDDHAACWAIKTASTPEAFREAIGNLLACNDDATKPEQGWPWPWKDSTTTDYAYAFVDGACKAFHWGEGAEWPDMTARKNVTYGPRSGTICIQG
jgi:hypothetical protein